MYKKVLSYIKENKLINPNDKVLVALSGGPDSICLLNILFKLKDELKIEIGAAHLNHMLRGEDAFKDEEYVKEICGKMKIPCYVKQVDINSYAKEEKLSSEMAGRNARYGFFESLVKNEGYNKIATAHNANDQAETVLFRLMRGTGLEGLGGIKVSRDNIIRPILCLTRKEVEKYIADNELNPRIDKTNFEKIYNRNKIRLDILPYIKENFNEDIVQTINRMALLLQKDNEFLEDLALKKYDEYCTEYDEYFIINKNAFTESEAIRTRIIRNAVSKFSKSHYDFEMKHIYEICNLSQNGTGKTINLPNRIYAENIYDDIYIKHKKNNEVSYKDLDEVLIEKNNISKDKEFGEYKIDFEVISNNEEFTLKSSDFVKYFDFDKLEKTISIRTRKNGDKIVPLGMKGSKKVKDIFIDMKIPKEERDIIPIICFDNNISWIAGVKVSNEYKITKSTKTILKVSIKKKGY